LFAVRYRGTRVARSGGHDDIAIIGDEANGRYYDS